MYAQGGSSTSPTKLSNGSKEGSSSGKTKEAKREGKEKLKVMLMMLYFKDEEDFDVDYCCRCQNHLPRQNDRLVFWPLLVLTYRWNPPHPSRI